MQSTLLPERRRKNNNNGIERSQQILALRQIYVVGNRTK